MKILPQGEKEKRLNKGNPHFLYFELIMLSDYKNIYPFWRNVLLNYFIKIYDDKDYKNPDGQINLYFSKLQIFFFYYFNS